MNPTPPTASRALRTASLILACLWSIAFAAELPPTPLEAAKFERISTSAEISAYLDAIAAAVPHARKEVVGTSVQGRPIEALVFTHPEGRSGGGRIKLMIIGSQHGAAEPAGGEALMEIARDLAAGDLQPLLHDADVILLPNANPDGRDLGRRANANWVNINTDFVLAEQAETRVLIDALARYRPDALLDSHESAILKRKTLAKDGYLTDFDAQFEIANTPGVTDAMRRLTLEDLLPALTQRVTEAGLPAHRYIGEITSIHQPVTNGGLTLRNFRNTSGMSGAASFLVETKLDSREDRWPTYRNIAVRVDRQLICLRAFLALMHERRADILTQVALARQAMTGGTMALYTGYVQDPAHPSVKIPMRRLDTRELEDLEFRDHRKQIYADEIALPATLLVTAEQRRIGEVLGRHHVDYEALRAPRRYAVLAGRYAVQPNITDRAKLLAAEAKTLTAPAGSLVIDVAQPNGRVAVMLLDPRSTSSLFRYPAYAALVRADREHFVYPAFKGVAKLP
ncbi:MAG TPA: M14 family zinc carboxypeptidase [Gammaproteobacteria bacterium]|nr:M14 family zinc carboxypeptidase [Gammaproteobacteria bacterium]